MTSIPQLLASLVPPLEGVWGFYFPPPDSKVMLSKESIGLAHCEAGFRMAELRVEKEKKAVEPSGFWRELWFGMIL